MRSTMKMSGCVVSFTMTLKLHSAALPRESRATMRTVVWPTGKAEPKRGRAHQGFDPTAARRGEHGEVDDGSWRPGALTIWSAGHWILMQLSTWARDGGARRRECEGGHQAGLASKPGSEHIDCVRRWFHWI